ncbi:hypothetical protein OU997_05345 [Pseudomonas sp. SL4(2022)]|uniref:hypothetical protein n=1 Tax=Pseudomonas sp. SL4(2022) TaxID=2994661 RepID=UPI00226D510D|nr:hypothetical protein [Pseudomonas sp. SL4(2022)]WAC45598.1 hypothetical protein OU997_05345 [Pseudomonas sp. SL4(2022)]
MSASVHALPSCPTERIFELRRAALATGCQFSRVKPKFLFATSHVDYLPKEVAERRYIATTKPPFDPNDGGHAA